MRASIRDVSRRLGLKGLIKRGGESWRTEEIKQLDRAITILNLKYRLLSKAEILKTSSIKEDIRAILQRHGPILWPDIQNRAAHCRWLHLARDLPEYPEDLYFSQHADRIYPHFETLLLSKLENFQANHPLSKLPSESDLTGIEESEGLQEESLILNLKLPNSKDKLQALKVEDENNVASLSDSRYKSAASKKRKIVRQSDPGDVSTTHNSKRGRRNTSAQSGNPSMLDKEDSRSGALRSGPSTPFGSQIRHDSFSVDQSNRDINKGSEVVPKANRLGITDYQHRDCQIDDHEDETLDELGLQESHPPSDHSFHTDDDAPVFPRLRKPLGSSTSSEPSSSGSPATSVFSKASPDATISALLANDQLHSDMRNDNAVEPRFGHMSPAASGNQTEHRQFEKGQSAVQEEILHRASSASSLSRDRSLVRRTHCNDPRELDPQSHPNGYEPPVQDRHSPSTIDASPASPLLRSVTSYRPTAPEANAAKQGSSRPSNAFKCDHIAKASPSQYAEHNDRSSISQLQKQAPQPLVSQLQHQTPQFSASATNSTRPSVTTEQSTQQPETNLHNFYIGMDLELPNRIVFRSVHLDDSYDVYQLFTAVRARFQKLLDGKNPTEIVLSFMDKSINRGREYEIEENRDGNVDWKMFLVALKSVGSSGQGVEGIARV